MDSGGTASRRRRSEKKRRAAARSRRRAILPCVVALAAAALVLAYRPWVDAQAWATVVLVSVLEVPVATPVSRAVIGEPRVEETLVAGNSASVFVPAGDGPFPAYELEIIAPARTVTVTEVLDHSEVRVSLRDLPEFLKLNGFVTRTLRAGG